MQDARIAIAMIISAVVTRIVEDMLINFLTPVLH